VISKGVLKMLTQEEIRGLFRYEDGNLFRNHYVHGGASAGSIVGRLDNYGYRRVTINKKTYKLHRIIFLYHHGYIPENDVDHIDQNPLNNRIENLREVSHSCNMRNSKMRVDNTSGIKGVYFHKQTQKWMARIDINNKTSFIGVFSDFTEAVAHRLAAEQCLIWEHCDDSSSAYLYIKNFRQSDE
jgi:hypothetical protein